MKRFLIGLVATAALLSNATVFAVDYASGSQYFGPGEITANEVASRQDGNTQFTTINGVTYSGYWRRGTTILTVYSEMTADDGADGRASVRNDQNPPATADGGWKAAANISFASVSRSINGNVANWDLRKAQL